METAPPVSVFGLGYVGSVTAACCASRGCQIIGVDVSLEKVAQLETGQAPIGEPGLDDLLQEQHRLGRIRATSDPVEAVASSGVSMVCVGTPSLPSGALDLSYVEKVAEQIREGLRQKSTPHTLIFRSTMLPGSTRRICQEYLQEFIDSGQLSAFFFPEFLRQGTALKDYLDPSLAALGAAEAGMPAPEGIEVIVGKETPVVRFEEAELLKYACNAFHASKVAFANEIGRVGKSLGIDSSSVMGLLCEDTRLNISTYYMRPGVPFGGSCLPKDVSALSVFSRSQEVSTPLLDSLLPSNERHLQSLLELVELRESRSVLLLGLAFKAGTDDLRGSAMLELAAALLLRGYEVSIYDPLVSPQQLIGANQRFARLRLPDLASMLTDDLPTALQSSEIIVASKKCAPVEEIRAHITPDHHIIDINGWEELVSLNAGYEGLCW